MPATYTGGAPGTPTYSWALSAPIDPIASLYNPSNASAMRVRFAVPFGVPGTIHTQPVTVTVTDSKGNSSIKTAIASADKETSGGTGGGGPVP